jgi:hypothetical protein
VCSSDLEVLTEEKIQRFEDSTKLKEYKNNIASLNETIKVALHNNFLEFEEDE